MNYYTLNLNNFNCNLLIINNLQDYDKLSLDIANKYVLLVVGFNKVRLKMILFEKA